MVVGVEEAGVVGQRPARAVGRAPISVPVAALCVPIQSSPAKTAPELPSLFARSPKPGVLARVQVVPLLVRASSVPDSELLVLTYKARRKQPSTTRNDCGSSQNSVGIDLEPGFPRRQSAGSRCRSPSCSCRVEMPGKTAVGAVPAIVAMAETAAVHPDPSRSRSWSTDLSPGGRIAGSDVQAIPEDHHRVAGGTEIAETVQVDLLPLDSVGRAPDLGPGRPVSKCPAYTAPPNTTIAPTPVLPASTKPAATAAEPPTTCATGPGPSPQRPPIRDRRAPRF